jgi:hypothetical protein
MKHREHCGMCKGTDVTMVLSLGAMPLANAFLKKEDLKKPEKKYPLDVYFCRGCASVQLMDIVDPAEVFINYEYLTSASKPLSDHFVKMAGDLCYRFQVAKNELVIEIGGNDGMLLEAIKNKCVTLNIDPAKGACKLALQKGVESLTQFFDLDLAAAVLVQYGPAKLVIANNVLAHIDNICDAVRGVKILIGDKGVFVFEVHWLGNLVGTGGFDQIYHEHIYYHSLTALKMLIESLGLCIFDVELVPIHGESMRVFVRKNGTPTPEVQQLLDREHDLGLDNEETFAAFSDKIFRNKKVLVELIRMLRRERNTIVGYGAPAKGNTLLNYYGLKLDYIIDTTPGKQGLYTPGTHIEVSPPERLLKEVPDYVLLLAWNYAQDILLKEQRLIERGVRFITPVPVVQITEGLQ